MLRVSINLTQEEFARQFEITLGTLRAWEEGVRVRLPDGTAITYLRLIEKIPDAIRQALRQDAAQRAAAEETHGARTA
jgi:putative transcriptional regulator